MWTCGKISCHVAITTFAAEAYQETCKCQKDPLYCESEKLVYLLKYKVCGVVLYVGQTKTKFFYRFYNWKHRAFKMGNQKVPQNIFTLAFVLMDIVELMIRVLWFFNPVNCMSNLKKGKKFGNTDLKPFNR